MTKLPSLQKLTAALYELNVACMHPDAGPTSVGLVDVSSADPEGFWVLDTPMPGLRNDVIGCEEVPGKKDFDAVAAARRLLAAAKDYQKELASRSSK
jgi:hypothetical protein